ncbi:MAG: carboxypeptidase-like regulatory domain-containing protein [bacterium]|nr:carboxypeptidase-like regulatory domain-containing protein [bacterium]
MPQSRLAFFVVVTAAILISAWLWWNSTAMTPPTEPAPAPVTDATSDPARDSGNAATTAAATATNEIRDDAGAAAVEPITDPTTATLRVLARWPDDVPAPGVMIALRNGQPGAPYTPFARELTDDSGTVEFAGVPRGTMHLHSDRGDRQKITVEGAVQQVVFELQGGITVEGLVVDPAGNPVAAAGVWLQSRGTTWAGGRVAATTDDAGRFELAHVNPGQSLGAVAANHSPSTLVDLDLVDKSQTPATVRLELGPPGGRLEGLLVTSEARPVPGALVTVGSPPRFLDTRGDRIVEQWSTRTATTDDDGRFVIDGLKPGEHELAMRHSNHGIHRTTVAIKAGNTTQFRYPLPTAGTLSGRVTDTAGEPIAKARVRLYDTPPKTPFIAGGQIDFDEAFGYRSTLTNEHGEYRLASVTSGKVHVFAQRPRPQRRDGTSVAYVKSEMIIPPGTEKRWDAVIDDGLVVEGIVLYRDGHPISTFITLVDEVRTDREEQTLVSGRNGVFRFLCLEEGSTYSIRVQHPFDAPRGQRDPLGTKGVAPNSGRVELRTNYDKPVKQAHGVLVGRIEDTGNRIKNPNAATIVMHSDAGWFRDGIKLDNGAFRIERIKPSRCHVTLMEADCALAQSEWFDIAPAATVDLGTLTTEPAGAARIHVDRTPGTEAFEPSLSLKREGDGRSTRIPLGRKNEVVADNLTPGRYTVRGWTKGMVSLRSAPFDVTMGRTVDVEVTIRAGAAVVCEVWWPAGPSTSKSRKYRVLDSDGKVLHEFEGSLSQWPTHPYELRTTLNPGRWRVEFSTDDGLSGAVDFDVEDVATEVRPRLELK